jgi:hypothetical protein
MVIFILLGTISSCFLDRPELLAQECKDEEAVVADYIKDLTVLVETTRKESLPEFEKAYHQKACLSKLGFCLSMVNDLLGCMEKASVDPTAGKDQADATKAKHDAYTKFKDKLEEYRKSLKRTDDSKAAKDLIGKFDFSN